MGILDSRVLQGSVKPMRSKQETIGCSTTPLNFLQTNPFIIKKHPTSYNETPLRLLPLTAFTICVFGRNLHSNIYYFNTIRALFLSLATFTRTFNALVELSNEFRF